jgi:hypothetical protein
MPLAIGHASARRSCFQSSTRYQKACDNTRHHSFSTELPFYLGPDGRNPMETKPVREKDSGRSVFVMKPTFSTLAKQAWSPHRGT